VMTFLPLQASVMTFLPLQHLQLPKKLQVKSLNYLKL